MMTTYRNNKDLWQRIPTIILSIIVMLLLLYIGSRFIRIASGPAIITYAATPLDHEKPNLIHVQGIVKNAENIFINDYPTLPATDGGFEHIILTQPGYDTITINVQDKFGNHVAETISLYTDEPPDSTSITTKHTSLQDDNNQ